LQPAFALSAIPDAILGTEHPAPSFAVQDREVANREPESSGLKAAVPALVDKQPIASLGIGKRIDSHVESIARRPARVQGPRLSRCRIR
jgi:hypothetical protein